MDTKLPAVAGPAGAPEPPAGTTTAVLRGAWNNIRGRALGGLFLVLPILITLWVIHWLYSALVTYAIDPLARLVLWKAQRGQPGSDLPFWFETYAAPLIALFLALVLLYGLGFFVHSRLRRAFDGLLARLPVVSFVYNGVGRVFQALEKQRGQQRPQRVVLVPFPHPGMRVAGFVTETCRDVETGQVLLCVCVPTSPVPTVGYLLLVPEDEVTELDWGPEQTLQTIISGGLTAPPEVRYFKAAPAAETNPPPTRAMSEVRPGPQQDGRSPLS